MIRFLLGHSAVWFAAFWTAVLANPRTLAGDGALRGLITVILLAPALGACAGAWAMNAVQPRRLFDRRVREPLALAVRGLAAGALSVSAAAVATALLDGPLDAVVVSVCAFLTSAAIVGAMPRIRPGLCIHCAYDLRDLPPAAPCPECGAADSCSPARPPRAATTAAPPPRAA